MSVKRTFSLLLFIAVTLSINIFSNAVYGQDLSALILRFNQFKGRPTDSTQVSVCNKLAEKFLYNNPDSSILFGKIALLAAKKLHLSMEKARAYNLIAKTYYVAGSYFESLSYTDSALTLARERDFKSEIAISINTRGLIYLGQNRFAEAIPEFSKALQMNEELKDSARIAANYFNIGLSYDEFHQFEKAFSNLEKALFIAKQCKDGHLNQMCLNRLGETYYHTKNYKKALYYFRAALGFAAYQDKWEEGFAYSGIAQVLYEMKHYPEALDYARKSFALMKKLHADWDTERAAHILSKCYAALKNYQKAYEYATLAQAYGDSIMNEKKEQEINFLHLQDKKAENLELLTENEHSRQVIRNNRIVISLTTLFSLLLLAAFFFLRRNIIRINVLNQKLKHRNTEIEQQKEEIQKQREELVSINITKDRVLSVIGHDLRSPFASVRQALELLKSGVLDKGDQEMLFENFHSQIGLVSELIDNLLAWASSQQSGQTIRYKKVNLTEATQKVISLYKYSFQQKKQHILCTFENDVFIEADENHVKIILQNILSNAIKFTPQNGTIKVFYTQENDFVAIHIQDNGMGMSGEKLAALFKSSGVEINEKGTEKEPGTGLGLLLIKQFVKENKGRIEVKSEKGKGSEFIVYFKSIQKTDPSF
jgi:signal transduction histidine kinase